MIWPDTILEQYRCQFVLKDSHELVNGLDGSIVPPGATLVTMDVESLYTNIDLDLLYETVHTSDRLTNYNKLLAPAKRHLINTCICRETAGCF